jgi:hypothetical protein
MNPGMPSLSRKSKIVKWLPVWFATVITVLPYNESRSRFLDRLIILAKE